MEKYNQCFDKIKDFYDKNVQEMDYEKIMENIVAYDLKDIARKFLSFAGKIITICL